MNYSLEQITTVADCDALLSAATLDRRRLDGKRIAQLEQYDLLNSSAGIDATLAGVTALVTAYQSIYDAMTDGPTKSNFKLKLQQQQVKQTQLQNRRDKYGILALLQKEFAITCIDQQIVESDACVLAVTDRKKAL